VVDPHETAPAEGRRPDEHAAVSQLVAAAQAGDRAAFEGLYRLHVDRIYALCLRMVADPACAEQLTQDAFVRAWEKLRSYRARGSFAGWLHRLSARVVIEDRRRHAREARRLVSVDEEEAMRRTETTTANGLPSGHVAPRPIEAAIDLERAIAQLPPGARRAFVLHDVEGYRHREIAKITGTAEGTSKTQLHRARRLLRTALQPRTEEILP